MAAALGVERGPFVKDLSPSRLEVAPDGVIAAFGLAQLRRLARTPKVAGTGIEVDRPLRMSRRDVLTITQMPLPGVAGALAQGVTDLEALMVFRWARREWERTHFLPDT